MFNRYVALSVGALGEEGKLNDNDLILVSSVGLARRAEFVLQLTRFSGLKSFNQVLIPSG